MRIFILLLMFSGCSHWLMENDSRLQLVNDSSYSVRNLRLVGDNNQDELWIPVEILAGEQSEVYSKIWSGSFKWKIDVKDSLCGSSWCSYDLGEKTFLRGSTLWSLKSSDSSYVLETK